MTLFSILVALIGLVMIIYITTKYDFSFTDIVIIWVGFSVYAAGIESL